MNKHFQDTRYYLQRAVESAVRGVREEAQPVEARLRSLTGREKKPAPSRLASIRDELEVREQRVEGEAREVIGEARTKLDGYRRQLVH